MIFCINFPNFIHIGPSSAEIWRQVDFEDGGRGCSILVPVSYFLTSLPSEDQCLSANQISSTYMNLWLRYNYFRIGKTNVSHIGILLPASISVISPQSPFCFRLPNFIQIGPHTAEIWHHFDFSRWQTRTRPLNTTSGLPSVDAAVFGMSKSISRPNFVDISWLRYNYFRFGKTNVRNMGNSTSGFDVGYVIQIGPPTVET